MRTTAATTTAETTTAETTTAETMETETTETGTATAGTAARDETTVVIVGAGVAGLTLGNLLQISGVGCVIVERRSREYVEQRQRAGTIDEVVRVEEESFRRTLSRGLRRFEAVGG